MNTKIKLGRLVLSATFGSLLWAGCASPSNYEVTSVESRPVDLTKLRPDTHPELNTGFALANARRVKADFPVVEPVTTEQAESAVIEEAAGSERPAHWVISPRQE